MRLLPRLRRSVALWLCPELEPDVVVGQSEPARIDQRSALIRLAETLAEYQGVTHFAISTEFLLSARQSDYHYQSLNPDPSIVIA